MDGGPRYRHVPLGAETGPARRFPYSALVFVGYALLMPLAAWGAARLFQLTGFGEHDMPHCAGSDYVLALCRALWV